MPRTARIVIPDCPHHVTQRGNNCQDVFFSDDDRQRYLMILTKQCEEYSVSLQGYCLMTNHVHLILTPTTEMGLARAVGRTNLYYTQHVNREYGHSGHLWQNRYFSCPMDRAHFFRAMVYVERNPVRAGLVAFPWEWPWSSANTHIQGHCSSGLLDMKTWAEWFSPELEWKEHLAGPQDEQVVATVRRGCQSGRPLGNDAFIRDLELCSGRTFRSKPVGRPKKKK